MVSGIEGRSEKRLQPRATLRRTPLDERGRHNVWTSGDGHACGEPLVEGLDDVGGIRGGHGIVRVTTHGCLEHACAVDRELDIVRLDQSTDGTEIGFQQFGLDDVLPVQGKRVACEHTTASSERQALDVRGLRHVTTHHVCLRRWTDERRIADRKGADLRRG